MKQLLSILLIFALLLSLCACNNNTPEGSTPETTITKEMSESYKVPAPMAYPDYTFSDAPTPMQLRETAVKAMKDLLSIQWCTPKEISYKKTGPVNNKQFSHKPANTYAGTLYSNASTGLYQFMEFYNPETGMLEYPFPISQLQHDLGNSCADSLLWGWSSVCNSITAGFYPVYMVQKNGYLPVGPYSYNEKIASYNECPSFKIIEFNGDDVICQSYAQMLPADALVSTSANHAMMVIKAPNVVYNDDGTINTNDSTVVIQDQRGGDGNGFYKVIENGNTIQYSGRVYHECSFAYLLEKHYIPVTAAEFSGAKAYEQATVTADQDCDSIETMKQTTVSSNYPLAVIRVVIMDENGNRNILGRRLFGGADKEGVPRSYLLSKLACLSALPYSPLNKPGNTFKIEVITSTGELFTPVAFVL